MDATEMANAYQRAVAEDSIWKTPDVNTGIYPFGGRTIVAPAKDEVDYSIVKMSDSSYIVARSQYLGSLDYDVICNCESRQEAREIVRALSK